MRFLMSPKFNLPFLGVVVVIGLLTGNLTLKSGTPWPEEFITYEDAGRFLAENYRPEVWKPAHSTAIHKVEYYPKAGDATGVMAIYFQSKPDKGYLYENVPKETWLGFQSAESPGGFYNQRIRGNRAFFFYLDRE